MIRTLAKNIILITARLRHPGVQFGSGSFIGGDCSFAAGAEVGRNASLRDVSLGRGAIVRDGASLLNSCCAEHVVINADSVIESTSVGRYSYIGGQSQLSQVEVGSFCSIAPGLVCGAGEHPAEFVSTHPVFFSLNRQCGITFASEPLFVERKKIVIGHDVWIGNRVFIRDGVTIGIGAIVAAGSVVVKDVPPYTIVGGVPAKVIRCRFSEEMIARLLDLAWWDWDEARLREAQPYMARNDVKAFLAKYSKDRVAEQ